MEVKKLKRCKKLEDLLTFMVYIAIVFILLIIITFTSHITKNAKISDYQKIIQIETGKKIESFDDYIEYRKLIRKN